jgi:hypothetical protein
VLMTISALFGVRVWKEHQSGFLAIREALQTKDRRRGDGASYVVRRPSSGRQAEPISFLIRSAQVYAYVVRSPHAHARILGFGPESRDV